MRSGFKFKDKHTNDFGGVTVLTQSRPIRPETKKQVYETPLMDGEYDFSTANMHGREFYNDRIFQLDLQVVEDNLQTLQRKLSKLAVWLMGSGELIFDDTPTVKWDARILEAIPYKPEHGKVARLSVSFRIKPFARLIFNVLEGPSLDEDAICLDTNIPLDASEYLTATGTGEHIIRNVGEVPVRPVITVSGTSGAVSIECNGHILTVPGDCIIDCEKQQVTKDGISLMNSTKGTFFEFIPGDNTVNVSADATVVVSYEPRYVYDADLSEVNWDE